MTRIHPLDWPIVPADATIPAKTYVCRQYTADEWEAGLEYNTLPPGRPAGVTYRTEQPIPSPGPSLPTEPGSVVLVDGEPWLLGSSDVWHWPETKRARSAEKIAARDWTPAIVIPQPDLDAHRLDRCDDGWWECGCGGWRARRGWDPLDRANAFAVHLAAEWGITQPAEPTKPADPLDETDHRDRLDADGDRWKRGKDGWGYQFPAGGWSLAEIAEHYGPLTFADDARADA